MPTTWISGSTVRASITRRRTIATSSTTITRIRRIRSRPGPERALGNGGIGGTSCLAGAPGGIHAEQHELFDQGLAVERLHEVLVRARLERDRDLRHLALRGHHHDAHLLVALL